MTSKEVWAALKEKGVTYRSIADGAYNSQENKAKAASKTVNERQKDLVKKYSDEPEKDIKALEQPSEKFNKYNPRFQSAVMDKISTVRKRLEKQNSVIIHIFFNDKKYIVRLYSGKKDYAYDILGVDDND